MNVELKYGHDRQVKDNIEFATSHDFSQERFCFSKLMNTHSHCTSFPCDILYSCFFEQILEESCEDRSENGSLHSRQEAPHWLEAFNFVGNGYLQQQ